MNPAQDTTYDSKPTTTYDSKPTTEYGDSKYSTATEYGDSKYSSTTYDKKQHVHVHVLGGKELVLICAVLFALAVYMLSAWLQEQPVPLPIVCSWNWCTLRCPHGCKMLLPGKCKLA